MLLGLVHKESVSKQGRKFAKGESSVQRDPLFDEMPEDKIDHMETENAQSEGRTREMEGVSTDFEKVSTDRPIVSTDGSKVSTDRPIEGTEEPVKGTDELKEGTEEQREGTEEKVESTDGQIKGTEDPTEEEMATQATQTSTQTPTSKIFGDDETIAKVLLNMSKAKAVSREKEKGVELKDVEEVDESESESDDIPQAEKKFKQLERLLDEKLQEQEREQFTIEERAKFLHDTIAAQRKFLAQQRSEAIRNKPPTKNQIKRSDEDFISIGSAEDERLIKRMNEKGVDLSKSEVIKEESKEEVQEDAKE
ncbi:hypothetical protein Tco_1352637 [Tanacetum coccineum]